MADHTPPITTSNILDLPVWNQASTFVVQLIAVDHADTEHDTPSGVKGTYYRFYKPLDPIPAFTYNDNPSGGITTFEIDGQGVYTVEYYSIDNNLNNEMLNRRTLRLDNITPISQSTVTPPDGQNNWYITNPTISLFATDENSGVSKIYHRWNSDVFTASVQKTGSISNTSNIINGLSTTLDIPVGKSVVGTNIPVGTIVSGIIDSTSITISQSATATATEVITFNNTFQAPSVGVHTLQFYAVDIAGNVEEVHSEFYRIDNVAPFTEDDAPSGLQKLPVTVHFFTSDDISGVIKTFYTTDGTQPTTSSPSGSSVTLDATGNYILKYFSQDYAGNDESVKTSSVVVEIDKDAPVTYISESFPINGKHGWYVTSPLITLTAVDPSGISAIKYELFPTGATTTALYTSPIELSAGVDLTANYQIRLQIDQSVDQKFIDLRGILPSQTTLAEIITKINTVYGTVIASETDIHGGTGTGYLTLRSPTAATGSPTSEVKFLDPLTNDATQIVFGLDNNYPHIYNELVAFRNYTGALSLPHDGLWQIDFYAIDGAGNQGATTTKQYKLDSHVPITTTEASFPPDGDHGWYKNTPDIILHTLDETSGIYKTFYQWDNDVIKEFVLGTIIQIEQQGVRTLKFYSIDQAGNIEPLQSQTFKLDYTQPETKDDSLRLQGVIYTAEGEFIQQVTDENSDFDHTELSGSVVVSVVKTANLNVKDVTKFYNATKTQYYHVFDIGGVNKNELKVLPIIYNENSTRLGNYTIQLAAVANPILRDFSDVLRIYNKTKNYYYGISTIGSVLSTGYLALTGTVPIAITDILEVDYAYNGPPISFGDILDVDYTYDLSHEVDVLNTLEYTILTPTGAPRTHDHDITIHLFVSDTFSGPNETFYTTDGSDPKTSPTVQIGTVITLTQNGTYTIKYYSVDMAGNGEDVVTAAFPIIIDKNIPVLDLIIIPDPAEDGENGWYKKNFKFRADITSDDIVTRINELSQQVVDYRITTGINDYLDFEETVGIEQTVILSSIEITTNNNKIDFEETVGIQKTATVPIGVYNSEELRAALETQLNATGDSNYTVVFALNKYTITSDLTGGANVFNILWLTGTNNNYSLVDVLGFEKENLSGTAFYQSINDVRTSIVLSATNLALEIQTRLNATGASTYAAFLIDLDYRFLIASDLSGGAGIFNILWNSGSHQFASIGKTIGFDISADSTGNDFYFSNYFKLALANKFVKSTQLIINTTTQEIHSLVSIDSGATGFYQDIIVNGNSPALGEEIKVDYQHYVGIERVDFGLDTTTFTTTVNINNDLEKFLGIFNDTTNFRVVFPALQGQFFLQDGQHTVFSKAFDNNSISGTGIPQKSSNLKQVAFKLDRGIPVTTDDVQDFDWRQAPVYVILTPGDPTPGSGISATHYTLDGNLPTRLSPKIQDLLDQKIKLDASGIYTIKYFSVDVAGNSEPVKTAAYIIKVDANVPETILITSPPIPDGQNGWFVNPPTISFDAQDFQSGIYKTFYKLPSSPTFSEYTVPFILTDEGSSQIAFYSIDNVGNQEATKYATVKFDQTAPVTTTNIPISGYTGNRFVEFTINDAASGGATTYFTINGSTPDFSSPSGSQIEFHASGTFTIKFFSTDIAGNVETVQTQTLNLDLEAPYITNFQPPDGIVTDATTQITFHLQDGLSGVDISTCIFEVDDIEYSSTKNTSYFHYTGTPANYLVTIYPVQGVLNFESIEILRVRNVRDFAGNYADLLEFNFVPPDTEPPRIRELYPIPNASDVSTNSNIVVLLTDYQTGVDIRSVKVTVNSILYSIVTNDVLKFQYVGTATSAKMMIKNNVFRTTVDNQPDLTFSLIDENYNTIKKINDYLDSLPNYSCSILDERFQQNASKDLLSISNVDITVDPVLSLFIPENNLNFAFLERENGYLIFVSPPSTFEHLLPIPVTIEASDNSNNKLVPYSYSFIPNRTAALSVAKRNYLNKTALTFIDDIQTNLPSNYTKSRSTNFYGHHKAIGIELSRVQEDLDHINEDGVFLTVRPQFLYEKFGYLLETEPTADLSHPDYRRLLISLLSIFFKGSLKSSLEIGVSLFTGSKVQIQEIVFAEGSDISDQFTFTADIVLGDNRLLGLDLQLISDQLAEMFRLVKPAHVFIIQRFIFTDEFAFQAGCTLEWLLDQYGNYVLDQFGNKIPILDISGFQKATKNAATAICARDRSELDILLNEDAQTDCAFNEERIRNVTEDVSLQFTGTENSFKTFYKPLLKATQPATIAGMSDVVVTVNTIPVTVIDLDPLEGIVTIAVTPAQFDSVIVEYHYNPNFVYRQIRFYLNDYTTLATDFDPTVKSILNTWNVNDILGGIDLSHLTKHAHICETELTYEFQEAEADNYEVPPCNDNEFFYLNNYSVIGNDFDPENGSYLNDLHSVNRSTRCPWFFTEIDEKQSEQYEVENEQFTGMTLEGDFFTEADYIVIEDEESGSVTTTENEDLTGIIEEGKLPKTFILNHTTSLTNDPYSILNGNTIPVEYELSIDESQEENYEIESEQESIEIDTTLDDIYDNLNEDNFALQFFFKEFLKNDFILNSIQSILNPVPPNTEHCLLAPSHISILDQMLEMVISGLEEEVDLPTEEESSTLEDFESEIVYGAEGFQVAPDPNNGILNNPSYPLNGKIIRDSFYMILEYTFGEGFGGGFELNNTNSTLNGAQEDDRVAPNLLIGERGIMAYGFILNDTNFTLNGNGQEDRINPNLIIL